MSKCIESFQTESREGAGGPFFAPPSREGWDGFELLSESRNLRKENFKIEIGNFGLKGERTKTRKKNNPKTLFASSFDGLPRWRDEWGTRSYITSNGREEAQIPSR